MVSVTLKVIKSTVVEVLNGSFSYPRVVSSNGRLYIYIDEEGFSSGEHDPEDVVFAPTSSPSVVIDGETYELSFGVDYDTALIVPPTGSSFIIKKTILPAELSATKVGVHPRLEWSSSYLSKTKIYRTGLFNPNNPSSDFYLVAEIDGAQVPGESNVYVDSQTSLFTSNLAVSYFLHNQHGYSNEVIVTGG